MTDKTEIDDGGSVHSRECGWVNGITRRDWLAGLAMQGMVANTEAIEASLEDSQNNNCNPTQSLSFIAYKYADAMIVEGRRGE